MNGCDDLVAWHDEQQIANFQSELLLVGRGGKMSLIRASNCGNNKAHGVV